MKRKETALCLVSMALLFALLLMALGLNTEMGTVVAAPLAAPTPVTSGLVPNGPAKVPVEFFVTEVITTDLASEAFQLANYSLLDVQYVIDQGTVNTATLKLQHSNDGSNWTDGTSLVTSNAADAAVLNQYYNFGRYTRVYGDVTNSNPVTVTVIGVAK